MRQVFEIIVGLILIYAGADRLEIVFCTRKLQRTRVLRARYDRKDQIIQGTVVVIIEIDPASIGIRHIDRYDLGHLLVVRRSTADRLDRADRKANIFRTQTLSIMPIDLLFELQIDISAFCVDRIAAHKLRYGAEIFVIRKETAVEQLGKIVYVLTLRNQRG